MSEAQDGPYFVANLSNQPLELHLPSGLRVLPPRGRATLDATDLDAPQLAVLRASRVLATGQRDAPPAPPDGHAEQGGKPEPEV